MEVHHHAHHEGKKNWKSYVQEFLMLFLAVFCGFLAEYQLEHMIEKERGKQYIRSFYSDLIEDTTTITTSINDFEAKLVAFNKCKTCYDSLNIQYYPGTCMLELFNNSYGYIDLVTSDQTLLQLKNAGGFRLLNKEDADSILLYDKKIRAYLMIETTGFQQKQYEIRVLMAELRNYGEIGQKVFTNDKKLLNKYFNTLKAYERYCFGQLLRLKELKQQANSILGYFKTKYNFEYINKSKKS